MYRLEYVATLPASVAQMFVYQTAMLRLSAENIRKVA
jgi:hypothetical protein